MLNRTEAPKFNEVKKLTLLKAEKHLLDNGLVVNSISADTQELVKIEFIFKAGVLTQKTPFLASATNTLIGEGTTNYTAEEISEKVDFYGAFLQKSVDVDSSSIVLYTLNKHINNVLPIFNDLIFNSILPQNELDLFVQNTKQAFNIDQTKVSSIGRYKFKEVLLGDKNPYGYNPKQNDFDKLTQSEIKSFYQHWYSLSKAQILVSGKVTSDIISALNVNFGQITAPTLTNNLEDFTLESSTQQKHFIAKDDAVQSAIRIGRLMFTRKHEDYADFQVLNCILGGYFGSRLMSNIREDKGYTYGIGSGLAAYKDFGYFFISTEVKAEVSQLALKEIYIELNRLRTELVKEEELELVKNYLMGSLLRSADGPFEQADRYKILLLNDLDYSYYDNYVNSIKTITSNRIMELANTYLKEKDLFEIVVGK